MYTHFTHVVSLLFWDRLKPRSAPQAEALLLHSPLDRWGVALQPISGIPSGFDNMVINPWSRPNWNYINHSGQQMVSYVKRIRSRNTMDISRCEFPLPKIDLFTSGSILDYRV